jgi:hypothetical protein
MTKGHDFVDEGTGGFTFSVPDILAVLTDGLLSRRSDPHRLDRSPWDVYLAPHADDVAFSIGYFAQARAAGRLLTVFGASNHTARPQPTPMSTVDISALRRSEDLRFAQACGLSAEDLGFPEAALRGHHPMDRARADEDMPVFAQPIMEALGRLAAAGPAGERPWLFAPMALGGHIDHAIILYVLGQNRAAIERRFRLAFYEDLPYAADYQYRVTGLVRFRQIFGGKGWRRYVMPLGANLAAKLGLIGLYESQHAGPANDILPFTPKSALFPRPHEALWIPGSLKFG